MRTGSKTLCVAAIAAIVISSSAGAQSSTLRGDANGDGTISLLDVYYLSRYLFAGGTPPARPCLADANHDLVVNVADINYLSDYLLGNGPAPPQLPEICNGQDDNCDGVVDEGFLNPASGLYDKDYACGSCGISCTPSGYCVVVARTTPICCAAGTLDRNGVAGDGCEIGGANAIYVSQSDPNAIDDATCGLGFSSGNHPCKTIGVGISRGVATSRPNILVAAGTYGESITLASGVSVYGGFNASTWARNPQTNLTTINGGNPAVSGTSVSNLTIDGFTIQGAAAVSAGNSSIAVLVASSAQVSILNNRISAGPGAGVPGAPNGATGSSGSNGAQGTPGCENSSIFCNSCSQPLGGAGGSSPVGRPGGKGGDAGYSSGSGAAGSVGQIGTPGGFGGASTQPGIAGSNGTSGADGNAGQPGASFGSFSGTSYLPSNGTSGSAGGPGNGGGGGGGGGGGTNGCDSYGSSGGGGGGGANGGAGGGGGTGGGGSFAIVLLDSSGAVTGNLVITASGGNGGAAGSGGAGGTGGSGGAGGPYGGSAEQDDGGNGAPGGHGGNGGRGGDGGGGGGGPSIGIVRLGTSTTNVVLGTNTFQIGGGGAGGTGNIPGAAGVSAQTRP